MAPEPDVQSLIDALDEPALIVERSIVRFANRAARDLLGAQLSGNDIRLAIRHPEALERLLAGTEGDCEISGVGVFERPWLLSIRRLGADTMLVRLADRTAAVSTERMRVDFVANASHELRTPLSTILGYSETLAEEPDLDPELRTRFARLVRSEAKRMVSLIDDLMNLSRIESKRFLPPADAVSIASVVQHAVSNLRITASAGECPIEIDVAATLPPVRGDQGQLVQLLDNLLTNAFRYGCTEDGSPIRIAAEDQNEWVRLSVADRGPGIPRQHLPRLTERFYRVDAARSGETGGTGLGLAIVKHIVERHRGTLDIRSAEGEGTEVIVRLPAAARPAVTKA
jgi:two-component system phosphate regulon sensor histidine kinase PhoR